MTDDLYELLGVHREAKEAEIKAAFRILAKKHHPDAGGDPEHFVRISQAYTVLMDPETRADYDTAGVVRENDVIASQRFVMNSLADLYETVLVMADVQLDFINIVESMKTIVSERRRETERAANSSRNTIQQFERARKRMKTKDGGKNLFLEITDKKIAEYREVYKSASRDLRMMDAIAEELERYTSIEDIVRTQFWFAGRPMQESTSTNGGIRSLFSFGN